MHVPASVLLCCLDASHPSHRAGGTDWERTHRSLFSSVCSTVQLAQRTGMICFWTSWLSSHPCGRARRSCHRILLLALAGCRKVGMILPCFIQQAHHYSSLGNDNWQNAVSHSRRNCHRPSATVHLFVDDRATIGNVMGRWLGAWFIWRWAYLSLMDRKEARSEALQ